MKFNSRKILEIFRHLYTKNSNKKIKINVFLPAICLVVIFLVNWMFYLNGGNRPPSRKFPVKPNHKNKSRNYVEM